jgi:tryptophanyl-tRNA synthetase
VFAALTDRTKAEVLAEYAGQGFGAFKPALAEAAVEALRPVTDAMRRLMADPAEIDRVLKDGAERAKAVADPIVAETKKLVGFWSA